MSGALARVRAWIVEPAPSAVPRARPRAPLLGVLAGAADVRAVGAAVALRAARGRVAVVAVWADEHGEPEPRPDGVAVPGARRLAAALRARELQARAAGRLVTVDLAGDDARAGAAAERVEAAAGDVPVVLAACGARGATWDALLATRDVVLVHARDAALGELTLARLAEQGVRATALAAAPAGPARLLALAGLGLPRGVPGLEAALREVAR